MNIAREYIAWKWLNDLLKNRNLNQPDKRMLYAYRLTNEEYFSLKEVINHILLNNRLEDAVKGHRQFPALFVIYASEWWRREYAGSAWSWASIVQSLNVDQEDFPANIRTDCVERGLAYWGHRPSSGAKKFIGAVVAHSGLPLYLISIGGGKISSIMERSIRLANRYDWDSLRIRESIEERKDELPVSIQLPEIFELIADMIFSVLKMKNDFGLSEVSNPIEFLNKHEPNWREQFPLPLDDQAAQALLTGLVQEAVKNSFNRHLSVFTVERVLKVEGDRNYRLISQVTYQPNIDAEAFAHSFGFTSSKSLPNYFYVDLKCQSNLNVHTRSFFSDGRLTKEKVILTRKKQNEFSGIQACSEHSLILCSSKKGDIGESFNIPGGNELSIDDPWFFVSRGEWTYVGSGSVRVPEEEVLFTLPDGWEIKPLEGSFITEEGLCSIEDNKISVFKGRGNILLISEEQQYRVQTKQSTDEASDIYWWSGRKFPYPSVPSLIFIGPPTLYRYSAEGARTRVPSAELSWFMAGTRTPVNPNLYCGPVDVFLIRNGETISKFRFVIIDRTSQIRFESGGTSSTGLILLTGWKSSDIAIQSLNDLKTQVSRLPNGYELQFNAGVIPPESITIELFYSGSNREVRLKLPFPSSGGRFFDGNGKPLNDKEPLPLKSFIGARIRVFDRNPQRPLRYEVVMTLRGERYIEIKEPILLDKDGSAEFELYRISRAIETLMSFSNKLDTVVDVSLKANESYVCSVRVPRYDANIENLPEGVGIPTEEIKYLDSDKLKDIQLLAKPITIYDSKAVEIAQESSEGVFTGRWYLENLDLKKSPWFIYPAAASSIYFRPTIWGNSSVIEDEPQVLSGKCPLAQAMTFSDKQERMQQLSDVFDAMANDFSHASWKFFEDLWGSFHHLPLSSIDLFLVLSKKMEVVVAAVLRSNLALEDLFELSRKLKDELGFIWELTTIPMWEKAISCFWLYWLDIFDNNSKEAYSIFQKILEERLVELKIHLPSLRLMLDYVLYEAIGYESEDLKEVFEQAKKDALVSIRRLWKGGESLGNSLLFVKHATDDVRSWPNPRRFFDSTLEVFVTETERKKVSLPILQDWFFSERGDFKIAVANAPILCALWAVLGINQEWWSREQNHLMLLQLKSFDSEWFEEAFNQTIAASISQKNLIYFNRLIHLKNI